MEREQIIKALECCKGDDLSLCRQCEYHIPSDPICIVKLAGDALSLIKELNEEIEELLEKNSNLHAFCVECEQSKADAIKKFAEKIKRYYETLGGETFAPLVAFHIDEKVKEMLEDTNES